jgi:anti-sigma-K factor RskA
MEALSCEKIEALLPAFVVDALDDNDESASVESHTKACPPCRAKLAEYRLVCLGLATIVPQIPAPAALKSTLLQKANTAPQPPRRNWADFLSVPNRAPRWVFLSLLAIVLLLGIIYGSNSRPVISPEQARIQALIANGTETAILKGASAAPNASGRIRYNPSDHFAALEVRDLPVLSESQSYHLWMIEADGKRESGAIFNITSNPMVVLATCDDEMREYVRFSISVEPAGGSPEPTGSEVLRS